MSGPCPLGQLLFVDGPSLRAGDDGGAIRSQLMRRRYAARRHRFQLEKARSSQKKEMAPDGTVDFADLGVCLRGRGECKAHRHESYYPPRANLPREGAQPRTLVSTTCLAGSMALLSPSGLSCVSHKIDPFLPRSSEPDRLFEKLLHHCISVLWPLARPVGFTEGNYHAYLRSGRSPMVMQAMLYSASLNLDALSVLRGVHDYKRHTAVQLLWKGQVLHQIQHHLSQVNGQQQRLSNELSDDILLSILYLAANEHLDELPPPEQGPFTPPFKSQQLLEYYGNIEFHPLHWTAVQRIVVGRGGLESVRLYGLAWLISLSGLIVAVNLNAKPVFPLTSPEGRPYTYRAPLRALEIPELPRHENLCNHGFQQLALLEPPIKGNLVRVFLDLGEITQALEFLAARPCSSSTLTTIGDSRALVQYRLSSLPDKADRWSAILHRRENCTGEEMDRSRAAFLICRNAAILYCFNVTFPLPRTASLRQKMTAEIHQLMEQKFDTGVQHEQAIAEILLWCSIIAGICTTDRILRVWFIAQVRRLSAQLGIHLWSGMVSFLRSFAWLDCASDTVGRAFFEQVNKFT